MVARLSPVNGDSGETDWPDPLDRLHAIDEEDPAGESVSASEQIYRDRG